MLFSPRHNQQLKTIAHSKMTTIQKMMKQVEQQEKKQQEKLRQEEQERGMIDNLNLYIPHVRDDVSKELMRENLSGFGKIKVIDFVAKLDKNNRNYNSAYVYFDFWIPTPENKQIQARIKQYTKTQNKMQSFKLNYDGNLHWILLENTSPAPKSKQERKVVIDLKTPGTTAQAPTPAPVKKTLTIDDYNVAMTEKEVSEWHKFGDELRAKKRLQEEAAEKRFFEQEKKFSDEADQLLTRANPELQQEELQEELQQEEPQEELQQEEPQEELQQEEPQEQDQEEDQEEELQEDQDHEQYYQSQMTQAFYQYYYWMTMEQRDMDEITTAMDEDDAWDAYLEQIHEECDFCENTLGRDEHEEQDGITTAVDYGYVERLEQELIKVRYQLRRSYS